MAGYPCTQKWQAKYICKVNIIPNYQRVMQYFELNRSIVKGQVYIRDMILKKKIETKATQHLLAYLSSIGYSLKELNNLSFKVTTIELLSDAENEIDKKTKELIKIMSKTK